jgi:hypothetical protein
VGFAKAARVGSAEVGACALLGKIDVTGLVVVKGPLERCADSASSLRPAVWGLWSRRESRQRRNNRRRRLREKDKFLAKLKK